MMDEAIKRDIVSYRRQKAHDLMRDVDILMENELWNSTVNRMYYACFHIISALEPECGRIFSKIYDKRQSSDYDDFREFTREEVENLYPQILFLIGKVDKLIEEKL